METHPYRAPHFLEYWREKRDLTQVGLAELVGCSQQDISRLEANKTVMDLNWAKRLAPPLEVTPLEVCFGPQDQEMPEDERAMLSLYRRLGSDDKERVRKIAAAFTPAEDAGNVTQPPAALIRLAREEGQSVEQFDAAFWNELDQFTVTELGKYPEAAQADRSQRFEMVAALYLLGMQDKEAGLKPDYARMRLFIKAQARSLRAIKGKRPQA